MACASRRQIATEVCHRCYERNPSNVSLLKLKCRSKLEHNQHDKVLVTEYYGTLVKIRPMPAEFRPPRFFRKCYDGGTCRFYPKCTYAHSEAEKNVWNTFLRDERERQRPQQHSSLGVHVDASASYRRLKPDSVKLPQYSKLQPTPSLAKMNSSQLSHHTVHHPPQTFPVWDTYWERQKHPPPEEDMMLPVTLENYRQKYRALLYYEEEEHVEVLKAKCNGQYRVVNIMKQDVPSSRRKPIEEYSSYAYIEGMSTSQIAYALQASSHANIIRPDNPFLKCTAMFLSCNYNTVNEKLYVGFDDRNADIFLAKLNGLILAVRFEVKHSYFNDLNIIVSRIDDNALKKILPSKEDFSKDLDLGRVPKPTYPQLKLESDQFRGLQTMLFSQPSAPVLIPGPFGCGKTRLLAVATEYVIQNCKDKNIAGRVLICCYQQDSANIFMNDYFMKMIKDKQNPWDVEVIHVTSQRHQAKLREDRYVINTLEFKEHFKKYQIKQYLVIVTTCGGALRMSGTVPKDYFTHILIDEGAQTREPETIAPLIMANKDTRIIIAGDSQQVGPKLVVLGDEPQQYGLGLSLLERLHNQYERFGGSALNYVVSLKCNYRCHPDLLELPSTLFYKSALVPQAVTECHPACTYPLKFICSSFDNDIPFNPENPYEASLILHEVNELLKYEGWDIEDVCIMAASLNQANCIRRGIYETRDYECIRGVNICTSYQIQGQEYSLLLISTSESLESSGRPFDLLKSFCHPAVFNTAITRARSLVVAVGNPLLLMTSEGTLDEPKWCWREFITRCLLDNAFVVPDRLKNKYSKGVSLLHKIRKSRQCNEIMGLFRSQSITMETKVPKVQSELGLKPSISSMQPPSKTELGQNEECNPWPEFDLQSKRKETILNHYSAKDATVTQELDLAHETKEAVQFRDNGPLLKKNPPPSSSLSSHETHKKLTTSDNICTTPKKSTYNPDKVNSMMVKMHDQDCSKQKKNRKRSKKVKSQFSDVFTHAMSQPTPMNYIPPPEEQFNETEKDNTKLQNSSSHHESISSVHIPKRQPSHNYRRSRQETAPKNIVNTRPAMTFNEVIPSFKKGTEIIILKRPSICHLQGTAFKHEHRPEDKGLLNTHLKQDNYKAKFHQLLCREEEEHDKILEKRCDGHYNVTIFHPGLKPYQLNDRYEEQFVRFGLISGDNLNGDTISYIKQACADSENIVLHFSHATVKADIVNGSSPKRREVDVLLIAFTIEELSKLIEQHYGVKKKEVELEDVYVSFRLKWSYFDRLHDAVDKLSNEVIERIMPVDTNEFTDPLFFENHFTLSYPKSCFSDLIELDSTQMKALTTIMKCECHKAPVLIIGSFGTGKTRLLARTAYQILQHDHNSRVLICAHHQSSADAFIENYFGKMYDNRWFTKALRIIPNWNYRFKKDFEMHYTTVKLSRLKLKKTHLVVTTFSTSLHLLGYVHKGFFTHILLDEGAQSREPESIAPLCLADGNTKIVIAGDHKQVGPSLLVLGDMAREHGLSLSLLERLHQKYRDEKLAEFSMKHTASLLTNYRCHHALLSLPSYLFYDSALITAAKSAACLHPKARFPLHFICSSLADDIKEITDGKNELEASLLLKEALKYIAEWPTLEWEDKDPKKVCIMAATANQKYHFYKELRKGEYRQLAGIEVLTAYDIQGREFEAVFLSTAEPTTTEGRSENPTKTPCSQYVFNTALTRAKSLVVCAGNPFLLMKIEEHMKNECSCWKDYIRRCVLSKTFHIPPNVSAGMKTVQESLQCLQVEIFQTSDIIDDIDELVTKDSILKSYQQAIQEIPRYKYCKLQIAEEHSDTRWDIVKIENRVDNQSTDDDNDIANTNHDTTNKVVTCELSVINQRQAKAFPINAVKHPNTIVINGYNHRRGAFDGDIVDIHVFGTHPTNVNEEHGRVMFLREARHPTKYVCRADQYSVINFYPLDKSVPAIVNLPKISQKLLRYQDQHMHVDYITVFKESSLKFVHENDQFPQIKELIPFDLAQNLLFVVEVLGWAPKYRKPLGAVVEALPRTTNLFFTEKLLNIVHNIESNNEITDIAITLQEPSRDNSVPHYDQAFTIDPPDSINLDDAISLVRIGPLQPLQNDGMYKLAILISNVAKYIPKDHDLDKLARQRGTSVYGGREVKHMLPVKLTNQIFSLNYNTTRDVLAVTATVVVNEGKISEVLCNDDPEKAQVTSQVRLTYEAAQNILDEKPINNEELHKQVSEFDAKNGDKYMANTLKLLFKIVMHLREKRLKEAAFSIVSDPDEKDDDCWQSHLLVSELMIWANSNIASFLYQNLTQMVLLRRQAPPQLKNLDKLREIFQQTLCYSLALKVYFKSKELEEENVIPLIITNFLLKCLKTAFEIGEQRKILWALSNDSLYPQLARASAALKMISQRAEYVAAKFEESPNQDDNNSFTIAHHSLQVDAYTHFTSPIRRYFDILVQRLVIALLDSDDIKYKQEELQKICTHLNMKTKMAKRYERSISKVLLARECETGLKCVQAFVSQSFPTIKENKYQLCIPSPDFKSILGEDTQFEYSDLNINRYQNEKEPKWHIVLASLDNSHNDLLCDPRMDNFTNNPLPIEETSGIYCCVEASVFSYLQASEELKDNQKQMKRVKYRASVIKNTFEVSSSVSDLAQQYLKSPSEENITSLMQKLPNLPLPNSGSRQPLYSEFSNSPVVIYDITRSFQPGEVVNVWFGKSLKQPLPSPELQLMEIAPTFRVCVQHNQNPALCFSDVQLQKASLEQYHSIDEYVQLWSKVLVAEAAYEGINTQVITMIKNARLEWPKKLVSVDNCIDEKHYKPEGELTLNIPSEKVNIFDFIKVKVGDLVCVRYDTKCDSNDDNIIDYTKECVTTVFHFVITKKQKVMEKDTKKVKAVQLSMKAMGSHCWISEKLKSCLDQWPCCEMQIIAMPISFNRVFNRLQSGLIKESDDSNDENARKRKCWSELTKKVAIGLKHCDNLTSTGVNIDQLNIHKDSLALRLWESNHVSLNQTQIEAVYLALQHNFQLIQGPPGTGKSVVGAHLTYIFSKINTGSKKCVLYCCPSNKAVDVVHKKLRFLNNNKLCKQLRIIRLYGTTHERVDFPDPCDDLRMQSAHKTKPEDHPKPDVNVELSEDKRKQDVEGRCLPELKEDALHFKIRQENSEIETMRLEYNNLIENENIIPSLLERNRYKEAIKRAEKKILQRQYDVILCTCNETCSGRLLKLAGDGRIAQCIVDECGMANEPETIAAASLCDHVVLIGDHKQLQPIIKYHMARECGMGVSLFERYAELRPDLLITLDTQYRMHETICSAPSQVFYDNKLQTDTTVKRRAALIPTINQFWPSVHPIVVFDIIENYTISDKKFTGKFDIHSRFNLTEALKVLEVIQELHNKHNISYQSMAVLTPYAAQKDLIFQMIRDDLKLSKESRPKVTTIVESQGDEYDIVILTTVRSLPINQIKDPKFVQADRKWMTENLGFLIDEHQVNVGITRAKHGLIIIGNTTLLRYDKTWRNLLEIYDSYGCIKYGAEISKAACN